MITYRIALAGLGNVGSSILSILHREADNLKKRYGVQFIITGVAELGGGAIDQSGLNIAVLLDTLKNNRRVADLADCGVVGLQAIDLLELAKPDILLEATPVNLEHGQPGLDTVRLALSQGIHAVLANKGPVALAYDELAAMSDLGARWGQDNYQEDFVPSTQKTPIPKLRFNACIAGALPTFNMGLRDLAGCRISRLEAVFNGTTQYILREMEAENSYEEALADAQRRGIAETDPTLDVDGWDAAAKLVIACSSVLGETIPLSEVAVQGIRAVSYADIQAAAAEDKRIVLVCLAELIDDQYQLSVKPTPLALDHPLARLTPDEMGVAFYTQDVERLSAASSEPGPEPAAAAMLRDMLEIVYHDKHHTVA